MHFIIFSTSRFRSFATHTLPSLPSFQPTSKQHTTTHPRPKPQPSLPNAPPFCRKFHMHPKFQVLLHPCSIHRSIALALHIQLQNQTRVSKSLPTELFAKIHLTNTPSHSTPPNTSHSPLLAPQRHPRASPLPRSHSISSLLSNRFFPPRSHFGRDPTLSPSNLDFTWHSNFHRQTPISNLHRSSLPNHLLSAPFHSFFTPLFVPREIPPFPSPRLRMAFIAWREGVGRNRPKSVEPASPALLRPKTSLWREPPSLDRLDPILRKVPGD